MTQEQAINDLIWFIKNSCVDKDSKLYSDAIASVRYICECKMIHYTEAKND